MPGVPTLRSLDLQDPSARELNLPWWQQMMKKSDEEVAMESLLDDYQSFVTTGRVSFPGEVWMPPVVLE